MLGELNGTIRVNPRPRNPSTLALNPPSPSRIPKPQILYTYVHAFMYIAYTCIYVCTHVYASLLEFILYMYSTYFAKRSCSWEGSSEEQEKEGEEGFLTLKGFVLRLKGSGSTDFYGFGARVQCLRLHVGCSGLKAHSQRCSFQGNSGIALVILGLSS